jgi:cation/acetate symporter
MLAGLIVTLVYIFLHKGWFFIPDTNSFTDADPLLGTIQSTSFGAVGAAINFAVAYLVTDRYPKNRSDSHVLIRSRIEHTV